MYLFNQKMMLETSKLRNFRKHTNIQRLNNMLLNKQWAVEETNIEIFFKIPKMKTPTHL